MESPYILNDDSFKGYMKYINPVVFINVRRYDTIK